jgi:hypothetical protein
MDEEDNSDDREMLRAGTLGNERDGDMTLIALSFDPAM